MDARPARRSARPNQQPRERPCAAPARRPSTPIVGRAGRSCINRGCRGHVAPSPGAVKGTELRRRNGCNGHHHAGAAAARGVARTGSPHRFPAHNWRGLDQAGLEPAPATVGPGPLSATTRYESSRPTSQRTPPSSSGECRSISCPLRVSASRRATGGRHDDAVSQDASFAAEAVVGRSCGTRMRMRKPRSNHRSVVPRSPGPDPLWSPRGEPAALRFHTRPTRTRRTRTRRTRPTDWSRWVPPDWARRAGRSRRQRVLPQAMLTTLAVGVLGAVAILTTPLPRISTPRLSGRNDARCTGCRGIRGLRARAVIKYVRSCFVDRLPS
jgi:hypothetical protein